MNRSPDIVERINQKDQAAFEKLFHALYPAIFSFAQSFARSSPLQPDGVKDAVSDSFVKLWQHQGNFVNSRHIRSFLFKAVRNACLDELKYQRIRQEKVAALSNAAWSEDSFETAEIGAELKARIYAAAEWLPRQRRYIFLLHFREGKSNAEIAAKLGITKKTVINQKSMAYGQLRLQLGKAGILRSLVFISLFFFS